MSRPSDYFKYRNGVLSVEGVPLDKIADAVGTPVYVYSTAALLKPLKELQKGLDGLDYMACYAMKANSNVAVLKLLVDAGAGLDIVSGGELYRAGIAGAPADRVVFSGVGKTPGEMFRALEYSGEGIFSFNAESSDELHVLDSVARKMKRVAPVALRFNPDVNPKTHPYISTGLKKNKFGIHRQEILEIAKMARKLPGISINGISVHIGSQLLSLKPLGEAFEKTRDLITELNSILPNPLSSVDLGGGVGITYHEEKSPEIAEYCRLIRRQFGKTALKILIEPGRLIAGNSGVLLTEALYSKERPGKKFLIVDAAMNDLIRPSLYESYHGVVPVEKLGGSSQSVDIVGPVCETGDYFARDRKVSAKVNAGSLLAVLSAGAYGFSMSSNYNSRPRPAEVLVQGRAFRVIRDRESYDDLIRGEHL